MKNLLVETKKNIEVFNAIRSSCKCFGLVIILLFTGFNLSYSQTPVDTIKQEQVLLVGVKEAAPFAMKDNGGQWTGISIYLWEQLANSLNYKYEFIEHDLEGLLNGVKEQQLDVGIAAITISKEREEAFDFSLPYFTTGLSIVTQKQEHSYLDILQGFFSWRFFQVVAALVFLLFMVGGLLWLVERKQNKEQFGGTPWHGIGAGFWWSAVTMTTVGYGDKAPVTFLGRTIGFVWMFSGIIIISGFTAAITSVLTIDRLTTKIQGPEDLDNVRVATVRGSSSADYLNNREINFLATDNVEKAIYALEEGKVDAIVYDAPILQYLIRQEEKKKLELLPDVFMPFYYGIALPESSNKKEEINVKLLDIISKPEWKKVLFEYLGSSDH